MQEIKTGLLPNRQQRGAVLIVALIMLLLLTLVGVAGIRDTQLQEKMAGGTEDRGLAFQAAESALRAAEAELTGGTCTGTCAASGYVATPTLSRSCGGTQCSETAYWAQYDWPAGTNSKVYAGSGLTEVSDQPRYVIELLPANYTPIAGTTNAGVVAASGVSTVTDFLITARGTGRTTDAVVILQSMYRYVYTTP